MLNSPQGGLDPKQAGALMGALNKPPIGAPPMAQPSKRDLPNPLLLDYRRIRISLERALENESDSQFGELLHAFHLAMTQREAGSQASEIAQLISPLLGQLGMPPSPMGAQPGGPPPPQMGGQPGAQPAPSGPPQIGMGPGAGA